MDWFSSDRHDEFRYVLVDKKNMQEVKDIDVFMDGGSIEYNDLTSLKVSGSLPFIEPPDIGFDYLRVYSLSRLGNDLEEFLHGTFIVSTPSSEIKWEAQTGSADIYSLLQIPADASPDEPITIEAGTNAITYAAEALRSLGLTVIADQSDTHLSTDANYDAGTSWLEIVNDLCTIAGFFSANVDPAGNIRLFSYSDPAAKAPVLTLIDDDECNYDPTIKYDFDIFEVPNAVKAVMSNDEMTMTAVAKNMDPQSIYSIPRRGREIAYYEEVSDIDSIKALQELAERRLAEKSSAVEAIEYKHTFIPYDTGEVIRLVYNQANFEFVGAAVKKSITLVPGMPCDVRLRRFVRG